MRSFIPSLFLALAAITPSSADYFQLRDIHNDYSRRTLAARYAVADADVFPKPAVALNNGYGSA